MGPGAHEKKFVPFWNFVLFMIKLKSRLGWVKDDLCTCAEGVEEDMAAMGHGPEPTF